jgi:hypothetical protein
MKRLTLCLVLSLGLLHAAAALAKTGHGHGHRGHGRHHRGHAFFASPAWPDYFWQPWAPGDLAGDLWCAEQHHLGQRSPACEGPGGSGPPSPPPPQPGAPPPEWRQPDS